MLEDPESQTEEWSQEIFADNEAQALRKCELIAQQAIEEGGTVVTLRVRSRYNGGNPRNALLTCNH